MSGWWLVALAIVGVGVWTWADHRSHGTAAVTVNASASWCRADPELHSLVVYASLHNSGSSDATVDVLPIRHYSDATTNASPLDTLADVKVPAGQTVRVWHRYRYEADQHVLWGCSLKIDDQTTDISLRSPG